MASEGSGAAGPSASANPATVADRPHASLVIDNHHGEFVRLETWFNMVMERWDLPARARFALDLVMNEAVTNVMSYAYDDDAPHQIEITLTDIRDAVVITVTDDGRPFNPLATPARERTDDLESAPIGGWGIDLIRRYSDTRHFSHVAGRNQLTLVVPRDACAPSQ